MDYAKESLRLHEQWGGKIEVNARVPVSTKDDLSLAYTPGVAQPCLEIRRDPDKSYTLTRRHNLCAVITDGSAVLGLGDIGPEAGMPVMEGKCVLFKAFADVDAFPLCIRTQDVDEFVRTVYLLSGSFGGINLEDISAPRCFEIERKLKELCDIPVFHDDQHGTAIITLAGLTNALRVVGKRLEDVKIVVSGAGAAAITLHGRTRAQGYAGLADRDKIAEVKNALSIPLIGNGDVNADNVDDMLSLVDAAAIGRAAVGNTYIFAEILGSKPRESVRDLVLRHIALSYGAYGDRYTFVNIRKHLASYLGGVRGGKEIRIKLFSAVSTDELIELVKLYFPSDER